MDFHILTLFPQMVDPYFNESILGRARKEGLVQIFCHPLRDYAKDRHRSVDDAPYGGGAGMVFKPDVVVEAVRDLKTKHKISKVCLLSPRGRVFTQKFAKELANEKSLLLICGRYEGVDERAIHLVADEEISIGDYVITGGELAAQLVVDAVSRFIPGVVGNEESLKKESHGEGLLEAPHYTRPPEYAGFKVPDVLLSGNHQQIEAWREQESIRSTFLKRPDLIEKAFQRNTQDTQAPIYIALLHYPVLNKQGDVVTTSITNFDLHDLARTAKTFGVKKCFIVTPNQAQQNMVYTIKKYWQEGYGAKYNPDRKEAFQVLEVTKDLNETCLTIQKNHDIKPLLIATTAKKLANSIGLVTLKAQVLIEKKPLLFLFGTGWGLTLTVLESCDQVLEPILGPTDYNHLPVRSAVAIYLDRFLGR